MLKKNKKKPKKQKTGKNSCPLAPIPVRYSENKQNTPYERISEGNLNAEEKRHS